jgi:hypothetical protein
MTPQPAMLFCGTFSKWSKRRYMNCYYYTSSQDMDAVCALALMQEDGAKGGKHKLVLKSDHSSTRSSWKAPKKLKDHKKADDVGQRADDKLTSLLSFCKAKGLCFKCGDKWGKMHTCAAQVPLQYVEEIMSAVH